MNLLQIQEPRPGNFLKYAGPLHWNDLPVDAHELIAMCAPRPVFISTPAPNWPTFLAFAARYR